MALKGLAGLLAASSYLLLTTLGRAECKMDNDCAGDLVCDDSRCVAPAPLPPAPPAPTAGAAAVGAPRPALSAEPRDPSPPKPKMRRHSTGMMVGGIVMTSIGGVSLIISGVTALSDLACNSSGSSDWGGGSYSCANNDALIYSSLVLGLGLVAGGVPMLVIGAKREPLGYAGITPWAAPHAGGLSLRLEL